MTTTLPSGIGGTSSVVATAVGSSEDKDIDSATVPPPPWNPDDPSGSLEALRQYAERQAARATAWYYRKKSTKARWSWVFRAGSIVLTGLGGLIPIAVAASPLEKTAAMQVNQLGYLCIGLAAVAIAFDRFAGSSTGWMRYIGTAMAIETLLEEFRLDWIKANAAAGGSLTPELIASRLDRVRTFSLAIRSQVERETQAWVTEFQSSLAQIEQDTRKAAEEVREESRKQADALEAARKAGEDAHRSGAIELTMNGGAGTAASPYDVTLDGRTYQAGVVGPVFVLTNLAPGLHAVGVRMTHNGTTLNGAKALAVKSGEICREVVELH